MADEPIKAEDVKPAAPVAKIDAAAEKAYAEAAAKVAVAPKAAPAAKVAVPAPANPAKKSSPAKVAAPVKSAKPVVAKKVAAKPAPAKKAPVTKAPSKIPASTPAPAAATTAGDATPSVYIPTLSKLKDTIMTTATKTDFTATAKELASDVQTRVKSAYAKTAELASEVTDFAKGNVEAVVESGKIFLNGAQEMVRDNVETTKTVIETVTTDAKKMMEVKSPTELMQMQSELVRRNFDAIVSFGSKRTEAWVKLTNEALAPITNRVSIAAEKMTKAA